jgi:putative PIN family toxin of toxin-antitoxin system
MRVVVDTNVFVSGAYWTGPPHEILLAWERGAFDLVVSPDILTEYLRVLREFDRGTEDLPKWEGLLSTRAYLVQLITEFEAIPEDPDDNKFLSAAFDAQAAVIVSGDKHLLTLGSFRGIRILTPAAFLRELGGERR